MNNLIIFFYAILILFGTSFYLLLRSLYYYFQHVSCYCCYFRVILKLFIFHYSSFVIDLCLYGFKLSCTWKQCWFWYYYYPWLCSISELGKILEVLILEKVCTCPALSLVQYHINFLPCTNHPPAHDSIIGVLSHSIFIAATTNKKATFSLYELLSMPFLYDGVHVRVADMPYNIDFASISRDLIR